MGLDKLINSITPDIYESLKKAVELGKWENGKALTKKQVEDSIQILIAYDSKHKPENERVGYVTPKSHSHCGSEGDKQDWQPLNIKE